MPTAPQPTPSRIPEPSAGLLERNLTALARTSPAAAQAIRVAAADVGHEIEFHAADDGAITATHTGRALASKRRPLTEAERLIDTIDLSAAGTVAVAGFGVGHHVALLARRLGQFGVVIVFEPDTSLLRAVFERIDCTRWLAEGRVILVTEPGDLPSLAAAMTGLEALAAIGLKLVEHPPSASRLGPATETFNATVNKLVRAVRTTVTTTLVQVEPTLRNLLNNLDHYTTRDGIANLANTAAGRLGVVVSAGPSLMRNLDLLADTAHDKPAVRDRCVIVAVQTVPKPMLARGIKPHFVVALDHHEISTRFYEGLTAEQVEGVTLVVDPKCNAAIPDAFPGVVRVIANDRLDQLLGESARPLGELPAGATVAHMAYYLARHLGCDPVALIGQDLGFTDNQYYAAGAAIHDVWASELSEFRTLEMLEWERIARERHLLTRAIDQRGNPIYTDEQMHHYLTQFERDFQLHAAKGLTTIDATEGGVAKQHTTIATLRDTLDRHAQHPLPTAFTDALHSSTNTRSTKHAAECVREVRHQAFRIEQLSRDTAGLLEKIERLSHDPHRINQLVGKITELRDQVLACEPGYQLVQHLNQTGSLNRLKDDRHIALDPSSEARDEQSRRAARDLRNVQWLADAAGHLATMLDAADAALVGAAPKITRDVPTKRQNTPTRRAAETARRVVAVIPVDLHTGGLGTPRDLFEPITGTLGPLPLTLRRLAACRELDAVALVCPEPDALAQRLDAVRHELPDGLTIEILPGSRNGSRAVAAARAFSPACWRGGLAGLTCYDEAFDADLALDACKRLDEKAPADAALVLGPDWCLIDPELTDAVIARYREHPAQHPSQHPCTFTQAVPGLAPLLLDRQLIESLAEQRATAAPIATIGGLLGYHPSRPVFDPIAKAWCVKVEPAIRDAGVRLIPDSPQRFHAIAHALATLGPEASAADVVATCTMDNLKPAHIDLHLTPTSDPRDALAQLPSDLTHTTITIHAQADANAAKVIDTIADAKPAALHVRTTAAHANLDELASRPIDVLSIDIADAATVSEIIEPLIAARTAAGAGATANATAKTAAIPTPWLVPRLERTDATLAQIEAFYDHCLSRVGCCVIDPSTTGAGRITPLPLPSSARRRFARERTTIELAPAVSPPVSPAASPAASRSVA